MELPVTVDIVSNNNNDSVSKTFRFEISDGLKALCKGIVQMRGIDVDTLYKGGVMTALKLDAEPTSRHLVLYLNEKYGDIMGSLREDINLY